MLLIPIITSLLAIIYEDFKERAIHWWWLPILAIAGMLMQKTDWRLIITNLFFLTLLLVALTIYFSIKEGRLINITHKYLGLGDILFFIPLGIILSPSHLILFFICSSALTLGCVGLYFIISKKVLPTIPLAGFQSLFLLPLIIVSQITHYDLTSDISLINFLF